MRFLGHPLLQWALGIGLGAVFLYASFDKIAYPADFARIVYHYQVIGPSQAIPPVVPNVFAVTLPWIEAVAGALLVAGLWRREAALLAALLLVLFLGAVGSTLYRGIDIRGCGCFSVSAEGRSAGTLLLVEDLGLLAVSLVLALAGPRGARAPAPVGSGPAADQAGLGAGSHSPSKRTSTSPS